MNYQKKLFTLLALITCISPKIYCIVYDDPTKESSGQETPTEKSERTNRENEFDKYGMAGRPKTISERFTDVKNWIIKKINNFNKRPGVKLDFDDDAQATNKQVKPSREEQKANVQKLTIVNLRPSIITAMDTAEITLFKPQQIEQLSPEQIQAMPIEPIIMFDKDQIQNFKFADLTIKQMTDLVKNRYRANLKLLTDEQLSKLSPKQIEICLKSRKGTFTEEQKDALYQRLKLSKKLKFESDIKLLTKFLQNSETRVSRSQETVVKNAIKKLSEKDQIKLFTQITDKDLTEINSNEAKKSTIKANVTSFQKLLPENEILFPEIKTIDHQISYNFKIVKKSPPLSDN